ncbi:amidohydrolase family protein [Comamonas terrigena]|uniref:amidohydrolase family protein n=1 Tax=Comamonas terrigena TaxID=32013 RepID=UPI0024475E31|nr:amidohydrolase family protein [Comamonas terrigena]MDH1702729.1 amidohydrolase family protein [Comamonas terrigena]
MSTSSLLLQNVRPMGGPACDLLIEQGRIAAMGTSLPLPEGAERIDGGGQLLLPGLVESHTHLDKTLWGQDWYVNEVGNQLVDKINNERAYRAQARHDSASQSLRMAREFLALGTTRIRSHADVDTDIGTKHVAGLLQTRADMAPWQDIQVVAFPQSGLLQRKGTAQLLDESLAMGADVLGGLDPCAIDLDPAQSLNVLFEIAERHNKPLDIHLHEPGDMGAFSLQLILDRTEAHGLHNKVVISHGFCLGDVSDAQRSALLARMAKLGVSLVTSAPPSRSVPPLGACQRAGVPMAGGNDGIRDTWSPYGRPDMLERAMFIGMRYNLRRDDEVEQALHCVTHTGAKVCGFADYGLTPGSRADLVLVPAQTPAHAVAARPVRSLVIAHGQIVAREGRLLLE